MKKLLLPFLIAVMTLPVYSSAQVTLSGALSGPYATLTAAFTAINAGGGVGTVTATITINHALTATASLNQTNYTVIVKPSGIRTVSGNLNSPLIQLNGADNVTIDGLNQLTISNSNTGATACAILLQTDASNNMVKNCTIEGATQATGYPFTNGVVKIRALSGSTGCDNNTITSNKIHDFSGNLPRHCIYAEGVSASVMNNNLVVSNNEISNFWNSAWGSHGFYSYRYNQSTQVTGNSFFQTSSRVGSGGDSYSEPIFCEDGVSSTLSAGFVISNNIIGGSAANATGAPYTINNPAFGAFQGIFVNLGNSPVNSIQGNTVTNIDFSTGMPYAGSGYFCFRGIAVFGGACDIGTTTGNSIGSGTGTGSIVVNCENGTSGSLYVYGIIIGGTGTCNVKNNSIGSLTLNEIGVGSGELSAYGIISFNDFTTIESNTIGSITTPGSIQMTGGLIPYGRLQGIFADNCNTTIKTNTVQNLVNNTSNGGELVGIDVWNATAGKSQTVLNNIVKNLSTVTGAGLDVTGILAVTNSASTISYTLSITGNTVSDCTNGPASTGECDLNGIWVVPRGSQPISYANGSVSGNTIFNLDNQNTFSTSWEIGILFWQLYNGAGMSISNNNIYNLTSAEGFCSGIYAFGSANTALLPAATTLTIQGNTIHDINQTTAGGNFQCGICFNGKTIDVSKNRIYGLTMPNATVNSTIAGTSCDFGPNTGAYTMSNNMISLGEDVTNDVQIQGIRQDNTTGSGLTLLYNSVFIGGLDDGAVNYSACFDRMMATPVTVKNNLFYNARTGSGIHLAIANTATSPSSGWAGTASNNNFLVSASGTSVGRWGGSDYSFSGWQTVSSGDAASVSKLTPTETQPANFFINTASGDLSVNVANAGEALMAQNIGVPVSVTTDFFGNSRSGSTPDPGAHEFATVLPLELESFTGKVMEHSNMLEWSTASERNVQWHIIDRSDDGIQPWSLIGKIPGKGDSPTRQYYQFEDHTPGSQSFYRLRTVDFDGREQLSNIVTLIRQSDYLTIAAVFPNPATTSIYIQFGSPQEDELILLVTDMTGRAVFQQSTSAISGINVLEIPLVQLNAGTYFVRIQRSQTSSEQVRFVKQ